MQESLARDLDIDALGAALERALASLGDEESAAARDELIQILRQQQGLRIFADNTMHQIGLFAMRATRERLAQWLIARARVVPADEVIEGLQRYVSQPVFPMESVCIVRNIVVERRFDLSDSIAVLP